MADFTINRITQRCETWDGKLGLARTLAINIPADVLALAWRVATEREATGHDKFNLGHLR